MTPFVVTLLWILVTAICGITFFGVRVFGNDGTKFSFGSGIALMVFTFLAGGCIAILIMGFLILSLSHGGM